ncbi:MAG: hypothetical protein R2712_16615 [Vicinamibacterales bacterium]
MNIINRHSIAGATLALALMATPALAQEPQQPAPSPMPAPTETREAQTPAQAMSLEGELLRVDADAKTIVVKTADGKEEQLRYTETTKITGGESGEAGLANSKGTTVSVSFEGSGADRVATEITINEKQ